MKIKHVGDYREFRVAEYPALAEQMDALWHAMNDGLLPIIEPMYSSIKAVKDKFPKSVSAVNSNSSSTETAG